MITRQSLEKQISDLRNVRETHLNVAAEAAGAMKLAEYLLTQLEPQEAISFNDFKQAAKAGGLTVVGPPEPIELSAENNEPKGES